MIRYTLRCPDDHRFESWFASADAFETLQASGMVVCPDCGSPKVEKTLMTPGVQTARKKAAPPAPAGKKPQADHPLAAPSNELEAKLADLRRHVEKTSDYVGLGFAAEARKMHEGEIPHRSIYGEAKPDEARKLIEDGVPVAPLPFRPTRKSN